jgi:hypothetical protein
VCPTIAEVYPEFIPYLGVDLDLGMFFRDAYRFMNLLYAIGDVSAPIIDLFGDAAPFIGDFTLSGINTF